jgi:DNA-binding response OmpR family regulator
MESMLPDLILLDLAMPAMDGWQVIDRLLASRRTSGIPVILQTSAVDFTSFERARRRGVAAFISKPFRLNEVVETCRRILEGARPLQGHPAAPDDAPALQVRDAQGSLLSLGRLLDLADRGAQAELDSPLELGQRVVLTVHEEAGPVTLEAEVRWVTRAGDRYHHGLVLQRE